MIQLAAVSKALDRAGFAIVSSALLVRPTQPGDGDGALTVEELEKSCSSLSPKRAMTRAGSPTLRAP